MADSERKQSQATQWKHDGIETILTGLEKGEMLPAEAAAGVTTHLRKMGKSLKDRSPLGAQ